MPSMSSNAFTTLAYGSTHKIAIDTNIGAAKNEEKGG